VKIKKVVVREANVLLIEASFQASNLHPLKLSTILDSGTTIDVSNNLSDLINFRKAPRHHFLIAGNTEVPILGYGDRILRVPGPNGTTQIIRLKNVAFCPDFTTNLVSFRLLRNNGYFWDNEGSNNLIKRKDHTVICKMKEIHGQQVIEYIPVGRRNMAFTASRLPQRKRITSRHPRPKLKGSAELWHYRMGHPGPEALKHLGINALGVKLNGPSTTKCRDCALAKIRRQTSRRSPDREANKPLTELHINWTDLTEAHAGYVRVMYIHDRFSGRSFPYFMKTHGTEAENLRVLKDFIPLMKKKYNLDVKTIRSDGEMNRKKTRDWLRSQGITLELSAP